MAGLALPVFADPAVTAAQPHVANFAAITIAELNACHNFLEVELRAWPPRSPGPTATESLQYRQFVIRLQEERCMCFLGKRTL